MTKVGKPYTMVYPNLELWSRLTRLISFVKFQPRSYRELSAQVGISKFWASMESEQHVIQGWTKDGPHHLGKLGEHIVVETYMDIEGEREIRTCYMCWKHEHPQNPQIWTLLLTNPKLPGHLLAWRLVVPVAVLVKSQNGNNEKNKRTNHVDLPRLVMKCVRGWDQ